MQNVSNSFGQTFEKISPNNDSKNSKRAPQAPQVPAPHICGTVTVAKIPYKGA